MTFLYTFAIFVCNLYEIILKTLYNYLEFFFNFIEFRFEIYKICISKMLRDLDFLEKCETLCVEALVKCVAECESLECESQCNRDHATCINGTFDHLSHRSIDFTHHNLCFYLSIDIQ